MVLCPTVQSPFPFLFMPHPPWQAAAVEIAVPSVTYTHLYLSSVHVLLFCD